MPDIRFNGVRFEEAIAHIKQKVNVPTERWDQMMGEAHAKSFTVAGATKADLVKDLHNDITSAIENGESIGQFRARFDKTVHQHGWSFKGDYGWRTRVIYDNNLRTAHMAGRWKQIERNKKRRPYLIYMTVGDERVREDHKTWHLMALAIDDPFWSTHYPPNGWGCRCYVITATRKQLEDMGIEIVENPGIIYEERMNTTTGEIYGKVPVGIDTGWDYNVGKAWLGPENSLGQKIQQLPPALKKPALADINPQPMTDSWQSWLTQVDAAATTEGYAHPIGYLDATVLDALAKIDKAPATAALIMTAEPLTNIKAIPTAWLQQLPTHLSNYQAVLLNKATGNLIVVLPGKVGNRNARAVLEISVGQSNNVHSLDVSDIKTLRKKGYDLIAGKL